MVEYFKFKRGRDSPSEARSALLVVVVLVATTTFQVGVNPPGGVWQDTSMPDKTNGSNSKEAHIAGKSILGTIDPIAYGIFVIFNTIGFSVALFMLNILTTRFPLQLELQICISAMFCTYNTALTNITPDKEKYYFILLAIIMSVIAPVLAWLTRLHSCKLRAFTVDVIHRVSMIRVWRYIGAKLRPSASLLAHILASRRGFGIRSWTIEDIQTGMLPCVSR